MELEGLKSLQFLMTWLVKDSKTHLLLVNSPKCRSVVGVLAFKFAVLVSEDAWSVCKITLMLVFL